MARDYPRGLSMNLGGRGRPDRKLSEKWSQKNKTGIFLNPVYSQPLVHGPDSRPILEVFPPHEPQCEKKFDCSIRVGPFASGYHRVGVMAIAPLTPPIPPYVRFSAYDGSKILSQPLPDRLSIRIVTAEAGTPYPGAPRTNYKIVASNRRSPA